MIVRNALFAALIFVSVVLVAREQNPDDKMALSGLTSNHNKVFGVNNLLRFKKDNPNILSVNIDPIEYQSWVQALNDLLNKGSNEKNQTVIIGIQRANGQLKTYLDTLNGLDKTNPETSEKIKKALQDVTVTQNELASLAVDKQSLIYAAYESVSATSIKIQKELSSLLDILQGAQLISYDADNLIKKTFSDKSYKERENIIKNGYEKVPKDLKDKVSIIYMKDALIAKNKELKDILDALKSEFGIWYKDNYIKVPLLSSAEKQGYINKLKEFSTQVRNAQDDLHEASGARSKVKKIDELREPYDFLVSKFSILEQNIDQLKIAIATAAEKK